MLDIFTVCVLSFNIIVNSTSLSIGIIGLSKAYIRAVPNINMRICTVGWLIGLLSMATGLTSYAGYCLIDQQLSFVDKWDVRTCQRSLLLYGAFLLRFSTLAIVVERGIATWMLKSYEGKQFGMISGSLIIYLIVFPILQLIAYYEFGLTGTKLTAMVFVLDIFAFVINENVRFLQILFPSALSNYVYCTFLAMMHVASLLIIQIPTDRRLVITHLGYSILVALSLFLPVFREGPISKYWKTNCLCFSRSEIFHNVNPNRKVVDRANWEIYFENYKKAWEPVKKVKAKVISFKLENSKQ
ncbi:hypothetical protein FO519_005157 [Halicephalobus sp. NKZ332]|nr:hypothetical protein FO519_005157 [Halicephalobus sp. NKZ332]